jgi:hypothetical protein
MLNKLIDLNNDKQEKTVQQSTQGPSSLFIVFTDFAFPFLVIDYVQIVIIDL